MSNKRKILDRISGSLKGHLELGDEGLILTYVQPPPDQDELRRQERGLGIPGSIVQQNIIDDTLKDCQVLRDAGIRFLYKEPERGLWAESTVIELYLPGQFNEHKLPG